MTELPQNMVRDLAGSYIVHAPLSEDDILKAADAILAERFFRPERVSKPEDTKRFLVHKLAAREYEVFAVIFLDAQHRIISFEEMFRGTIAASGVYPREVVKRALAHNASALIFAHNHPSGSPEPSAADGNITRRLKDALALVDVRVLDHIVVGGTETVSFAEKGLI